jgi:polar amino acid transport system ATP-binding protein/sulfate transport system ATP-binding protein
MTHSYTLGPTLVKATDVTMKFGETLVLKPTSIEVKDILRPGMAQGQVVGILGPSGCGKTTFARILAGLQTPTTGTIQVADIQNLDVMKPVQPGLVGMVAQKYPLFPWRTVQGNLMVALEHSPWAKEVRLQKVQEYLELFGLADKLKCYPAQLSGGQQQRVSIIRELLCSEHYLVMDEPFTGLDPIKKDLLCRTINKVATLHEQNTIFIVAHDIDALVKISDCLWLFGRERDQNGNPIPGSAIRKSYNLIERGLAWEPDIAKMPAFHEFKSEVRAEFDNL